MGLSGSKEAPPVERRSQKHSTTRAMREEVTHESRLAPSVKPESLDELFDSRLTHMGPTVPKTEATNANRMQASVFTVPARAEPAVSHKPEVKVQKIVEEAPIQLPKPQPKVIVMKSAETMTEEPLSAKVVKELSEGFVKKLDHVILAEHLKQLTEAVKTLHERVSDLENAREADKKALNEKKPQKVEQPEPKDEKPTAHTDLIKKMREQLNKRKPDLSALEETRNIYKKMKFGEVTLPKPSDPSSQN